MRDAPARLPRDRLRISCPWTELRLLRRSPGAMGLQSPGSPSSIEVGCLSPRCGELVLSSDRLQSQYTYLPCIEHSSAPRTELTHSPRDARLVSPAQPAPE